VIDYSVQNKEVSTKKDPQLTKFFLIIPATIWLIIFPIVVKAQPEDQVVHEIILKGINLVILQEYDSAMSTYQKILEIKPDDPRVYFFQAAVLQSKMQDYETDFYEEEFNCLIILSIEKLEQWVKNEPENAWAYFYLGNVYGYKAIYEGRTGKWWSGFRNGRKSLNILKKCTKLDPELYDAYLAIGTYQYWRSSMTRNLWWLPFIGDEREEGIQKNKLVVENGVYGVYPSLNNLAWIYIDYKRPEEAIKYAQMGLVKFPRSRFFLWPMAYAYKHAGQLDKAGEIFKKILDSTKTFTVNNHYVEIVCRLEIAEIKFQGGDYESTKEHCSSLLSYSLSDKTKKRAKKRLKKARELIKWSDEQINTK